MLVVDASVVAPALASSGDDGRRARARLTGETLAAPHLLDIEVASTFRGLVRAKKLTPPAAELALTALSTFPAQRAPHSSLLDRIWGLRDNLTAYDATYVALAERLGATLLTAHARIAAAPGLRCPVEVTG